MWCENCRMIFGSGEVCQVCGLARGQKSEVWHQGNARFERFVRNNSGRAEDRVEATIIDPSRGRFTCDQERRNTHISEWRPIRGK